MTNAQKALLIRYALNGMCGFIKRQDLAVLDDAFTGVSAEDATLWLARWDTDVRHASTIDYGRDCGTETIILDLISPAEQRARDAAFTPYTDAELTARVEALKRGES